MRALPSLELDGRGEALDVDTLGRRIWSREQKQRIVDEALMPNASVAAVARHHSVNANLVFKWIKQAEKGWPDRRRSLPLPPEPMTFVPIEVVETIEQKPVLPTTARRPVNFFAIEKPLDMVACCVIEISMPNGVRIGLNTTIDETTLRLVLLAMKEL